MNFYTVVLRKSAGYWVALCLENGIAGQSNTKDEAILKLKEALASFEDAWLKEPEIYEAPISIKELHEFLTVENILPVQEIFELRAINA